MVFLLVANAGDMERLVIRIIVWGRGNGMIRHGGGVAIYTELAACDKSGRMMKSAAD